MIVFPIAAVIHAPGVHAHLTVDWPVLLTLIPLACVAMTSLGLLLGTVFEPRNIGLMFGFVVVIGISCERFRARPVRYTG